MKIQTTFVNGVSPFPAYTPPPPVPVPRKRLITSAEEYRIFMRETGKKMAPLLAFLRCKQWVYMREIREHMQMRAGVVSPLLAAMHSRGLIEKQGRPGLTQYRIADAYRTPPAIEWTQPQCKAIQ